MRIGFIGTGVITKAIVTGLVISKLEFESMALSPRNASNANELAALDRRISVCSSNQEVIDTSDVICIAVVPQIAFAVLNDLRFNRRHQIISFVPGLVVENLKKLVHPADQIARAIPLPAVAYRKGCTAIFPPSEVAKALFSALGTSVEVMSEHQFDALSAVTATMASFYAVLEDQAAWLQRQGLPYSAARSYLSGYSVGLAHETTLTEQSFPEMIENLMTPGGLNEQLHAELQSKSAYRYYGEALDRIFDRIKKAS